MATTERVLRLLDLLHRRRTWTGAQLAEALGVTTRCVRRDVQRLRDLGYPVDATGGVGGGYRLGRGSDVPPLPLDPDEALAVAVGLRFAATGGVHGLRGPALAALAKLEAVLPRSQRARLSAIEAASEAWAPDGPTVDAGVLMALATACRDSLATTMDYRTRGGDQASRRLQPLRLVHSEQRWYLLAWDRDRSDWRTFRLDRVRSGSVALGAPLPPRRPPTDDVAAYVGDALTKGYRHQARVRLHAPAEIIRPRIGRYATVTPAGDDHCWLDAGADDLDGMARWLVLLAVAIDQVTPEALREAMARLAEGLSRASRPPTTA